MSLEAEVDAFISRSNIDSRAAAALKAEDTATQKAVIERGDMADCRNTSASLMARIKVAKENLRDRSRSPPRSSASAGGAAASQSGEAGSNKPSENDLEGFILENKIDESAGRALREADALTQKAVLDRGNLTDCRNPSAVLLARIKDARASTRGVSSTMPLSMPAALPATGALGMPLGGCAFGAMPGIPGLPGMPGQPAMMYPSAGYAYPGYPGSLYGAGYADPYAAQAAAAYGAAAAAGAYPAAAYGHPGVAAYGAYGAFGAGACGGAFAGAPAVAPAAYGVVPPVAATVPAVAPLPALTQ